MSAALPLFLALAERLSPHLTGSSAARLSELVAAHGIDAVTSADVHPEQDSWIRTALAQVIDDDVRRWAAELERLASRGIEVITCDSDRYPVNLQLVHNRPPMIFVRGELLDSDQRAIAVVGTRSASREGLDAATGIAAALAGLGVTVTSGLAAGIDAAAHQAAIDAGGRTLAVFGTGIERVYPSANRGLAQHVIAHGACVSQFWPTQTGAKWTFPLRNIVTSGLSLGTVVVEAGPTSGAKLQAMDALRQGRRLFLVERLVLHQEWAAAMVSSPGVKVVKSVEEIVDAVEADLAGLVTAGPIF